MTGLFLAICGIIAPAAALELHQNRSRSMFGIKVTSNGIVGWIVGKDADIWLFKDKASAAAELKRLKADERYSWNCEAVVAEFPGWGKK